MKGIITLLLSAIILIPAFSDSTSITVHAIKFNVDDLKFRWDTASPLPENESGRSLQTIASYSFLEPGLSIGSKELEKETARFETRLNESGMFFGVQVYIAPPRQNPDRRTIIVKARKGTRFRFMGGAVFASYGRLGMKGYRNLMHITAGYNRGGITYSHEHLNNSRAVITASLVYENTALDDSIENAAHTLSAEIIPGFRPHPDLYLGTGVSVWMHNRTRQWVELSPRTAWTWYGMPLLEDWSLKAEGRGGVTALLPLLGTEDPDLTTAVYKLEADAAIACTRKLLFLRQSAAVEWAGSALPRPRRADPHKFIRIPFNGGIDEQRSYLFGNTEAGLGIFRKTAFSLFTVLGHAYLFHDLAVSAPAGPDLVPGSITPGAGTGLRILFDTPVFVTVDFSIGWSYRGEYRIRISISGDLEESDEIIEL